MFVTPLVAATPARVRVASGAGVASARLKGKIEQVVQTDLFGSRKLSRAELGPARLRYLGEEERRSGLARAASYTTLNSAKVLPLLFSHRPRAHPVYRLLRLSGGVSCRNSCFSVGGCDGGLENSLLWGRPAPAYDCSAWSRHYSLHLKGGQKRKKKKKLIKNTKVLESASQFDESTLTCLSRKPIDAIISTCITFIK